MEGVVPFLDPQTIIQTGYFAIVGGHVRVKLLRNFGGRASPDTTLTSQAAV
jgi:hypothetical protein